MLESKVNDDLVHMRPNLGHTSDVNLPSTDVNIPDVSFPVADKNKPVTSRNDLVK